MRYLERNVFIWTHLSKEILNSQYLLEKPNDLKYFLLLKRRWMKLINADMCLQTMNDFHVFDYDKEKML